MSLSLAQARQIIVGALKEARSRQTQPLGVIVLDPGGSIVAYEREDAATLFRFDLARAKATGALGMGADTRDLAARAAGNPTFFGSLAIATGGNVAFSPGGVLVRDASGAIVGAVGISGDTGDIDELCAFAGIEAANLQHGAST